VCARSLRRIAGHQGGGAAVEFAVVAPLLIALIAGILTIGWAFHSISSVRYALEEAGRALQLDPDMTETELAALVEANVGELAKPDVTVTLIIDEPDGGIRLAHATAQYALSFSVPLLPPLEFNLQTSVTVPLSS
jgi:Flp pilus assembly protein TadG